MPLAYLRRLSNSSFVIDDPSFFHPRKIKNPAGALTRKIQETMQSKLIALPHI